MRGQRRVWARAEQLAAMRVEGDRGRAVAALAAELGVAERELRQEARCAKTIVPSRADLPDRLDTVLHVIYLVFNEGYSALSGASLTRADLSGEAIRLGRLLMEL